eukprot:5463356-Amphidinium_carterae.1
MAPPAPTSQQARGLETPTLSERETAFSEARVEKPGGSPAADYLEEPGGSSVVQAPKQCALCKGTFLELQLQERKIRSQ